MNKRAALEKELIGDIEDKHAEIETGKDRMTFTDPARSMLVNKQRDMYIKQGIRRRHPDRVLAQFAGIKMDTSNAESAWEQAIMHEQDRTEIPEGYRVKGGDMIANQTGLITTALDNFQKSKNKFNRVLMPGV